VGQLRSVWYKLWARNRDGISVKYSTVQYLCTSGRWEHPFLRLSRNQGTSSFTKYDGLSAQQGQLDLQIGESCEQRPPQTSKLVPRRRVETGAVNEGLWRNNHPQSTRVCVCAAKNSCISAAWHISLSPWKFNISKVERVAENNSVAWSGFYQVIQSFRM
jgi:hypothetical protein